MRTPGSWKRNFDLLAMPATPVTVPPVGMDVSAGHTSKKGHTSRNPVDWSYYTYPFNLSGHPCVFLPIGLASKGMPVGLQLVARRGDERTLLAAAAAITRTSRFDFGLQPGGPG